MRGAVALVGVVLAVLMAPALLAADPGSGGVSVKLTPVGRFDAPTHVTAPPRDESRLFVVEKSGIVRILFDGKRRAAPFLDLTTEVRFAGNEQGLLSLAFAPGYARSGRFYVYYVDQEENGLLVEFRRSHSDQNRADPNSRRVLLRIERLSGEHYGGLLLFGPDGYLYVGIGDGGLERDRDPLRAQRGDDLNGTILRIDPRMDGPAPYRVPPTNPFVGEEGLRPEIWAFGLRNPWRYWIDRVTGDLYVGDVGEFVRESLNYAPAGKAAGANFGWPCFEGGLQSAEFGSELCPGAVPVLLEYAREGVNCSIIGGLVVRDPRLKALAGRYLFSDFCGGEITSILVRKGKVVEKQLLDVGRHPGVTSFGEDARGRVYVATLSGPVYRLDLRAKPSPANAPVQRGRGLFVANCGGCHTLAAARTAGATGPNLDKAKPARDLVIERVTSGSAQMPSFKDALSTLQIEQVAEFVIASAFKHGPR